MTSFFLPATQQSSAPVGIVRSALGMSTNPAAFFLRLARTFGPFAHFHLGSAPAVLLTDPASVDYVLHQKSCLQAIDSPALKAFLGERSLILLQGESWFTHRKLLQGAMHRPTIAKMTQDMASAAAQVLSSLPQGVVNVGSLMHVLAQMVLAHTMIHTDDDALIREMAHAIEVATHITGNRMGRRVPTPSFLTRAEDQQFAVAIDKANQIIHRLVRERRAMANPPHDMLTMMVTAQDADTGQGMSDAELRDELITMFLAGQETTATTLVWALLLLSQHPQILERLRAESVRVLGASLPSMATLGQLTYTRQVVDEVLRLCSPSWLLVRRAEQPVETPVGTIDAGTLIAISPFVLHRQPSLWPDPARFDPARFDPAAPKPQRGSYLPFGGGPRICLGEHFARTELIVVLALLARDWTWQREAAGSTVRWKAAITLQPSDPILMRFSPRPDRPTV